ncbi:putative serine carboxypeptidase-like protein 2 [Colletotrichum chlorophyti]|uniref:Carboxypeptidase n=1 Tax=Colletotrichum chlorophyti TaxID=708187 RepID=A0A1Q8S3U4_9PEZI|nr:putative serine carboxypeptidase-like protein 2 [Colletotrichum chlorophyti]
MLGRGISWPTSSGELPTGPPSYFVHKAHNLGERVEYPIGTGFSSGNVTAANDAETADQFVGFWKNFVHTFDLQNKRIFISGESYAGVYVPFVGAAMLDKNDPTYFDVKGAVYYNPVMPHGDNLGFSHAALPAFHRYWENVFGLPSKVKEVLNKDNEKCGLDNYLNKHLTYPPPARPWPKVDNCHITAHFRQSINVTNPCFNIYHILDQCPVVLDALGIPSIIYAPPGFKLWFNCPECHVPVDHPTWRECQDHVYIDHNAITNGTEHEQRFQTIVERTNNVHVASGQADYMIQPNVTTLAIQGTIWNGKQGFQEKPSAELLLPTINNNDDNVPSWAGGNVQGTVHTERGFTHSAARLSGHMVPQYAPAVAFRHVEHLLGRVKSLSSGAPWSVNISTSFKWPY